MGYSSKREKAILEIRARDIPPSPTPLSEGLIQLSVCVNDFPTSDALLSLLRFRFSVFIFVRKLFTWPFFHTLEKNRGKNYKRVRHLLSKASKESQARESSCESKAQQHQSFRPRNSTTNHKIDPHVNDAAVGRTFNELKETPRQFKTLHIFC